MVDIENLRREAMRLGSIDLAAAQLLQAAGDEIEQLRIQRAALLPRGPAPVAAVVQAPGAGDGVRA